MSFLFSYICGRKTSERECSAVSGTREKKWSGSGTGIEREVGAAMSEAMRGLDSTTHFKDVAHY
jgi:hypothetical protein